MSAIDELREILGEMADLEEGEDGDSILFTHDLCVNAVAELDAIRSDNKMLRDALGVADNAIQIAIGYVFPSQGVGGATMHLRVASDTIAAALVRGEAK